MTVNLIYLLSCIIHYKVDVSRTSDHWEEEGRLRDRSHATSAPSTNLPKDDELNNDYYLDIIPFFSSDIVREEC